VQRRELAGARPGGGVGTVGGGERAIRVELDDGVESGIEGRDAAQVELDETAGGKLPGREGAMDRFDGGLLQLKRGDLAPAVTGEDEEEAAYRQCHCHGDCAWTEGGHMRKFEMQSLCCSIDGICRSGGLCFALPLFPLRTYIPVWNCSVSLKLCFLRSTKLNCEVDSSSSCLFTLVEVNMFDL